MLGADGEYLTDHLKSKLILTLLLENCEKVVAKHFIEKPILFNLVNLSTMFCPILWLLI